MNCAKPLQRLETLSQTRQIRPGYFSEFSIVFCRDIDGLIDAPMRIPTGSCVEHKNFPLQGVECRDGLF